MLPKHIDHAIFKLSYFVIIFCCVISSSNPKILANASQYCPPNLRSLYIKGISFPPYLYADRSNVFKGELVEYIDAATRKCCPKIQVKYYSVDNETNSSDDIEEMIRSPDPHGSFIYFPVFANKNEKEQFNRFFLGMYESSGFAVIQTENDPYFERATDQIDALLATWPLLLACGLTATLAGVIMWILDCRQNKDFSTGFLSGAGAGVWWSFVTMTTVGYGDKSPKSFFGRSFAILWMIIGTILLSILSGQITAYLTTLQVTQTFTIQDKEVAVPLGVQNFLEKELSLGAKYEEYPIINIIKAAIKGDASSIGGRKYAILYDYEKQHRAFLLKMNKSMDLTIKTMITHPTYLGIVCTHEPDDPLRTFFKCWQKSVLDQIAIAKLKDRAKYRNQNRKKLTTPAPKRSVETNALIALSAVVGAFIVIGLIWELSKRSKQKKASVS